MSNNQPNQFNQMGQQPNQPSSVTQAPQQFPQGQVQQSQFQQSPLNNNFNNNQQIQQNKVNNNYGQQPLMPNQVQNQQNNYSFPNSQNNTNSYQMVNNQNSGNMNSYNPNNINQPINNQQQNNNYNQQQLINNGVNNVSPVNNNMNNDFNNMTQQNMQMNNNIPKKEKNPKKILLIILGIILGVVIICTGIGVISCAFDNMPSSGTETYQKVQSDDVSNQSKFGPRVLDILASKYPETKGTVRIVKVERENPDTSGRAGFEYSTGTYKLEDENGTEFQVSYTKNVTNYTYSANKNEEYITEEYYAVKLNKELAKELTDKLKEDCTENICCMVSANYYNSSHDSHQSAPSKSEYLSKGQFQVIIFTGDKKVELNKVGESIRSVIKSNDTTRTQIYFNGKMNYKVLDSGQAVDIKANAGSKDFVNFADVTIERNGTVTVNDYSDYAFKS